LDKNIHDTLFPLEREDLSELRDWLTREEVHKNLYMMYCPMSLDDLAGWYTKEKNDGGHLFGFRFDNKKIIGMGLVHYIHDKNRCGELSIMVSPDHFGQGRGRSILLSLMGFAFDILNLHKIFLHTTCFNERMIRLIEHIGFTREAVYRKELVYAGEYHGSLRYGMLDNEYRST